MFYNYGFGMDFGVTVQYNVPLVWYYSGRNKKNAGNVNFYWLKFRTEWMIL